MNDGLRPANSRLLGYRSPTILFDRRFVEKLQPSCQKTDRETRGLGIAGWFRCPDAGTGWPRREHLRGLPWVISHDPRLRTNDL